MNKETRNTVKKSRVRKAVSLVAKKFQKYWKNVTAIVLSFFLMLGSLYQLEIVFIAVLMGKNTFDFPFFMWSCDIWVARDLFYLGVFISWILLFIALWWFSE